MASSACASCVAEHSVRSATPMKDRRTGLRFWLIALLLLGLGYAGFRLRPHPTPPPVFDETVATVAGETITLSDLRAELERRARRGASAEPGAVLEDLIRRETLVARARELGLAEDPELVLAWKRLLIAELKKRELEPRIAALAPAAPVATEEASAKSGPEGEPRRPVVAQARVAILRQEISARTSEVRRRQSRAALEEARRRAATLGAGVSDFGAVAVEFSDDQATRYQGGDLGWVTEADSGPELNLDPRVLAAVRDLRTVGEVSPVIEAPGAYYVVRLAGRRELVSADRPGRGRGDLTEAGDIARFAAQRQAREAQERGYEEELRTRAGVVIHPDWQTRLPVGDSAPLLRSGGPRRDLFP